MTASIAIGYGAPADPAAFDRYYREVHLPLARAIPGLQKLTWDRCAPLSEIVAPFYSLAILEFPDATARTTAMASPEMTAAGRDVRNFADGGATMFLLDQEEPS